MVCGISIYVHIPFCAKKCNYCDFNSYDNCSSLIEPYFDALTEEIICTAEKLKLEKRTFVDTIFFGGGTPTFPPYKYVVKVLEVLRKYFIFAPNCEITIESNPGTVTNESLKAYFDAGFNRLSIGLQSANDCILENLGRIHKYEHFVEEISAAREVGFSNINVDLMFGLPNQKTTDLLKTVDKVLEFLPTHISCYSLIVEEGTPFYDEHKKGCLIVPDDKEDREMYHLAIDKLASVGLNQYEISNFAFNGYECRHNVKCWKYYDYVGFGAGACSLLTDRKKINDNTKDVIRHRRSNIFDVQAYIDANDKCDYDELIDFETASNEVFMLGLRLIDGVDLGEFKQRFGIDADNMFATQFERLINKGIVKRENNKIMLTEFGLDFANQAFMEFI